MESSDRCHAPGLWEFSVNILLYKEKTCFQLFAFFFSDEVLGFACVWSFDIAGSTFFCNDAAKSMSP